MIRTTDDPQRAGAVTPPTTKAARSESCGETVSSFDFQPTETPRQTRTRAMRAADFTQSR
jgi:hypothetical protein